MASFHVEKGFRIEEGADVRFLTVGAVYMAGDTITGLSGAEAAELLKIAPEGALTAADEEAETLATRHIRLSGSVAPSGDSEVQ